MQQKNGRSASGCRSSRPATIITIMMSLLLAAGSPPDAAARPGYPKVANFYIDNEYHFGDVYQLAKWDLLVLDVDTPPTILAQIRAINPSIKILAFIPINGTYESAYLFPAGSRWRMVYEAAQANNWWLRDTAGGIINDHPGKLTTNLTSNCPRVQGKRFTDWFPEFVLYYVINGPAAWDGVALDDVWISIHWIGQKPELNSLPIDSDRNGVADTPQVLDPLWYAGSDALLTRLRQILPPGKIVIGNGSNDYEQLNGAMIESFPFHGYADPGCPFGYSWTQKMFGTYGYFRNEDFYNPLPARYNIVNAKWQYGDRYFPEDVSYFQQHKRFTLVSSMLRDGYYSMDWDDPSPHLGHNSMWWLPEFDIPIGNPLGAPYQVTSEGVTIWRRDYSNGAIVLNPTNSLFPGSPPDSLPPLPSWDAKLILKGQFWHPDAVPPAALSDLFVSEVWADSVELTWTNTGDNGLTGQATWVITRFSELPITELNFQAAQRAGSVAALAPGQQQSRIVTGLLPGHRYYFASKVIDLSNNYSAVSNVPSTVTSGQSAVFPDPAGSASLLGAPRPNPSAGSVEFLSEVPPGVPYRIDVIDTGGRFVRRLEAGEGTGSQRIVPWDGLDGSGQLVPAGIYFAVLEAKGHREVRKIVRTR